MKISNWFIVLVSLALIAGGLGCAALSEYITPGAIDSAAVKYAIDAGIADANEFDGYKNLYKAKRLETAVADGHEQVQLDLMQLAEKDNLLYAQLEKIVRNNRINSQTMEEQIFGEKGFLTMALSLAGFGTLTGIVGLMRKRPGDVTPEELKQTVSGTEAVLSEKEKQIVELVKGVQDFLDLATESDLPAQFDVLKTSLAKAQSTTTKAAVAVIKAAI